jgi:selenium metabolism protein YedF
MTFLYLSSDRMGNGDDELGRLLMKNFLAFLAESDTRIDSVGCVNDGVRLTTEGSQVLYSLRVLSERGARITSCVTCLEHLGLDGKLRIGDVGTMPQTVEAMSAADKIIQP